MANREVQRARVTAIVFGTLSSVALIAFVYAFIQQGLAKSNMKEAEQQTLVANQNVERLIKCEQLSSDMQRQAEQQRIELERKSEALEQELKKLNNRRLK
jgi:transposase